MQTNECPADSTGALFSLVCSEKGGVDDLRSKSITSVRAIAAEPNARSTRSRLIRPLGRPLRTLSDPDFARVIEASENGICTALSYFWLLESLGFSVAY